MLSKVRGSPWEFGPQGNSLGEHWEVNSQRLSHQHQVQVPASSHRHLLGTETASIVVKKLLQEIIPRFKLPVVIGSDNGPAFVAKGQEKLKAGIHNHSLAQVLIGSARTQRATHKLVRNALPVPAMDPVHPFQPGDSMWGLYTVILSTPTAVKVDGVQIWLHHSQHLHQETAWILAASSLTHEIPSLGSTQARRRLDACRRETGLQIQASQSPPALAEPARSPNLAELARHIRRPGAEDAMAVPARHIKQ
ncbi:hypothetical protein QTO34_007567 [Cnephaeus nilssonii]|uniref:Uncharacterized protein n=1 Tax=Cnephaeus nilssonii TaxID=3371016 RepID=A0AA40LFR0_CNENI|nr:hypothetical protein QTO34_007567 [Eptesicus nilssonii]